MKYIAILLLAFSSVVSADRYDSRTYVTEQYITEKSGGNALGIAAAQHQFDFGTYKWQGSAAIGHYDSDTAFSLGIGRRTCKTCPMFNGSIGVEDGKVGAGAGFNWRF